MGKPVTPANVRFGGVPLSEIPRGELERRVCALIERTQKAEADAGALRAEVATLRGALDIRRRVEDIAARVKARTAEAARIAALAGRDTAEADRLRSRLHTFLSVHQIDRIDTQRGSIRVQKNGGKAPLVIVDETIVPQEMKRATLKLSVPVSTARGVVLMMEAIAAEADELGLTDKGVEYVVDKDEVRAAIEDGVAVPGVYIGERSTHLVIR